MEIKAIAVENFRSHLKYELELEKVTLLTGSNGAGKSTLLEAAATALIGENTWTARDGIKLKNMIRRGAKSATVSIVGKRTISRVITASGSKILLDGKDPLTQFELLQNLKVSESQVRAALIPTAFLSLPGKDQQDALYSLVGASLTLEEASKYVPESETWTKLAKRWKEDHEDEEFVDLDKLYDFVYQARRSYKSKTATPQSSDENQDLIVELGEISKQIAAANFKNQERQAKEKTIATLSQLESDLEAAKAASRPGAAGKLEEARAEELECAKKDGAAMAAVSDARQELAGAQGKTGKGGKVVCPIGLECPHDEDSLKKRQTYLKGQVVAREGEYKSTKENLKRAKDRVSAAHQAEAQAQESQRQIASIEAEIKKLQAMAQDLKASKPVDTEALKRRKEEIEKKMTQAISRPAEADRTIENLNAIVEALAVDGIKAQIVRKHVGNLEGECNKALSQFGGMQIRFFLDGEWRPCIIHSGSEVSTGELSEGERLVTSLVIQDVFAQRAGVNLVVVDNVDLLDAAAYRKFVSAALNLKSKVLAGLANLSHQAAVPSQKDGRIKVVDLGQGSEGKGEEERRESPKKRPVEDIL